MQVLPGTVLGHHDPNILIGEGTYLRNGFIHSSRKGILEKTNMKISVLTTKVSIEIKLYSIVIGRVTKISTRHATVDILAVGDSPLQTSFPGIILQKDIRLTGGDEVLISDSFRPGDIVKTLVVALGDQKSFHLSTARNELGVILAQSIAGHTMVADSWDSMLCPVTKVLEKRKCAKPSEDGDVVMG